MFITYDSQAQDDSLVLYLPFDEGGGDPEDFSMYENELELVNNPKWVDGKYGNALEFDGTNYVMVPIDDILQLVETFTVEFWVKREAAQPATWNYMVAGGSLKWAVIVNSNQNVYVYTRSGGTWAQRLVTTVPLTTDWTHIAMTYDVDSGVELYFNGTEKAGEGDKPPVVDEIDGSIMVGARHPGQEFFAGIIDEVALYNRILSLDEIQRDMEAVGGAPVTPKDKLASIWGQIKK
jgi:hypothetical protein